MNPVSFPTLAFEYIFYSTVFLIIGILGIFACMVLLDFFDTGKKR
jgi:hypothetical protein